MSSADGNLIATYSLVYSFLTERSHFKAAEAVKKAAKDVIVIKGGGQDGPTLPVIVKQWKKFTADQGRKATFPYVLCQPAILASNLRTTSDRSELTRSKTSGPGSHSDCMVLVQIIPFCWLTCTRPSQLRRIQNRAQRKLVPNQVCALFSLVVTKSVDFRLQTPTHKPAPGRSKAISTPKQKRSLNKAPASQSRRLALSPRSSPQP